MSPASIKRHRLRCCFFRFPAIKLKCSSLRLLDSTLCSVAMDDVKKWSVTYTKHIKQKRKVYQDGFLQLHTLSHKAKLYDECDNVLEIRILKNDEVVRSGETLTFNSYLVDVGDPEGDHKPIPNFNCQVNDDKKITHKSGLLHNQKFRTNPIFVETKVKVEKNTAPQISPAQKLIREFKKSKLHKYGAIQSSPDTVRSDITEWQALYTTHITQKAKKYHDGILRLAFSGSHGRQVMLYDVSRRLLDSRFLKKDEVIRSGDSLAFDAHLVDIGEPERDHKPLTDLNVQGRNSNEVRQTGISYKQESLPQTNKNVVRKWHALYTAQVTQKAKKYHSGILRLSLCGTRLMQVTLLNEDGATLSSKHLKFSEDINSGSTLTLPKYLVEVGEPWTNHEGDSQNTACMGKDLDSNLGRSSIGEINSIRSVPTNQPFRDGNSQNTAWKDLDSNLGRSSIDTIKLNMSMPANKPLRDASKILSILKSSRAEESVTTIRKAPVEQFHASQSSNLVHSGLHDKSEGRLSQDSKTSRSAFQDNENDFSALDERNCTKHTYRSEISKSNATHYDLPREFIKLENSDSKGELQPNISGSSSFSFEMGTSNVLRPKFDDTNRSSTGPAPFMEGLQGMVEDTKPTKASVPHDGSNRTESADIGESLNLFPSKEDSSCSSGPFSKSVEFGSFKQGALTSETSCVSHGPGDGERKIFDELETATNLDELPSFDLGF